MIESARNQVTNYTEAADTLYGLELEESHGKGVEFIHWIVEDLQKGNIDAAKANYRHQSDKYDRYPKTKAFLKNIGIVEEIDWSKYKDED